MATEGIIPVGIGLIICLAQTSLPIKVLYVTSLHAMSVIPHLFSCSPSHMPPSTRITLPQVATYKPPTYQVSISPLLVVNHGIQRNYQEYRDFAMKLADQTGALVLSPEFDKER